MGFRITTNMMMNSYRYNLQNSTKKLSDARDMVLTGRYFNSYAEDPAAATLAFRLRRSWYQTSNYLSNTKDVYSKFNTAWNNLTGIVHDLSDATARVASIRGNNGATGEARSSLAVTLREMAESVVQAMNQKLGDHFIFAGNDALNAPFSWKDGKLLYRGVDVLGGWKDRPTEWAVPSWYLRGETPPAADTADPEYVNASDYDKAWMDYYWDQAKAAPNPAVYVPEWAKDRTYFDADGNFDGTAVTDMLAEKYGGAANIPAADQAWIEYFTAAGGNPVESSVPDWYKNGGTPPATDKNDPNYASLSDYEKAWVDYYNYRSGDGEWAPDPSEYSPVWAQDSKLKELLDSGASDDEIIAWIEDTYTPGAVPTDGVSNADMAWLAYCKGVHNAGVTAPVKETKPDWANSEIDPETGLPTNIDQAGASSYDQAWVEYFEYQKRLADGDFVPNPSTYRPDWEQYFDKNGKLDEAKLRGDLGDQNGEMSPIDEVWIDYYNELYGLQEDLRKLQRMSGEEMYIDLGMGASENFPNSPVKGTYFNNALCGIDFIGYGVDDDGDPKNLALIMRELADVFDTWDEDGQMYLPDKYRDMSYEEIQSILKEDGPEAKQLKDYHAKQEEKAFRLMDKLKAAQEHLTAQWVDLDAQSVYLQSAESRLTTQATDLNIQFLDVEQVDLAEAITNFSWQQYCYNAALKIGNQLLTQSLIDYMG